MKIRGYCLFFVAALCLLLSGCGLKDYPTYTYQLSNKLGERYLINYCEQTGYPDNSTRVKIFKEKEKIGDYDGGAYTGCDSYIPSQIMLIASKDKVDYYPEWVDKHGLRFVYRMYKEPHTRKRYAKAAFVFPVRFLWEKVTG